MAKTEIALLYERLSRDDELQGESCSIQNQKIMLEDYARRNGFPRFRHHTDDGVSGTRFDRPGFMAMMEEVEDGGVEAIIVKDMSRLGRDYLKVGQVMEILRQRGVRLIAINDNVDTAKGDNDMTPFLNIMYEFYARDTSRKIKSVFKAKGMSGKHLTGTVIYGYLWDEKRENWIVDDEATAVVRRIFAMTLEGYGPYQIATRLAADKIEIPAVHLARHGEGVNKNKVFNDIYRWGASTVVEILKKREYLGHMQRVAGTPWEMPVVLGGLYGMRRSEILGLRWQNVDLENRTFDVVEQLPFKVPPGTKIIEEMAPPKSNSRTLPITDLALPFFLKQFAMQEEQREQAAQEGKPYYDNDLVVAKPNGVPMPASWISGSFGKMLEDVGLPRIRFHDLRHSAATNMHQLTGDFYTVGEILGHTLAGINASLGLSMNFEAVTARYVDVRFERKKEVLEAYHGTLKETASPKRGATAPKAAKGTTKKKAHEMEL